MKSRTTLGFALVLGLSSAAEAQQAADETSESDRAAPWRFDAALAVSETYTDNVFITTNQRIDDLVTVVEPSAELRFRGARHEASLTAGADIARYRDNPDEDYDDYRLALDGRFAASDRLIAFGGAEHVWSHENRQSPEDVNGETPTEYTRANLFGGVLARIDGYAARAGVNYIETDFDDVAAAGGGLINNDDRDGSRLEVGLRVGRSGSGEIRPFVQATYDERAYDSPVDDFGFHRDSAGFHAAAGVEAQLAQALTAEVFVGMIAQNYDDPAFDDVEALDFGVDIDWRYAPNGLISASAGRSLQETTLPGAPGYLSTHVGASFSRRVVDRLTLTAHLRHTENDYQQSARTDRLLNSGVGARYFATPRVFVGAGYSFVQRNSNTAGADFTENRILARIGAQTGPAFDRAEAPAGGVAEPAGAYLGLQAGSGDLVTNLTGPRGTGTNTADFGAEGAVYGAFAGYGARIGEALYAGVEVDVEDGDIAWDHLGGRTFGVRMDDAVAASVRLGHAAGNGALAYGRFGVINASIRTPYNRNDTTVLREERDTGLVYGGGLEFPVSGRMFGRLDYSYATFEDYSIVFDDTDDNFANTRTLARVGLGYRFGAPHASDAEPVEFGGPYLGLYAGHGTVISDNEGPRRTFDLSVERAGHGASAGAYAGYGRTFGPVYLGAEIEAGAASASWNIERDPQGRIYSVQAGETLAAGVRAGAVIHPGVLAYLRADAVETQFRTDFETDAATVAQDDRETGLRLGAGVETSLGGAWRLRAEYTRTDYGTYVVTPGEKSDSFENRANLFRFGLGYRF
ncbi:outer membrane beta-barrel protein [Marinicauda salina]|nr:outer membrane beta-barrel protein [Marinicauda salina]